MEAAKEDFVKGDLEQMENEQLQDDFSFKKVWELLKASFTRIVVFCVIAAIVMAIVSALVLTTTRKTREQVSATITFSHSGIEEGKAPDGTNLNVNRIKSPQIVTLAINEFNASAADKIDINKLSAIIQNLEVAGHLPANILTQIEYELSLGADGNRVVLSELLNTFPSQYSVSVKSLGSAGITKEQAVGLINEIINQYIKDFKKTYGSPSLLDNLSSPILNRDTDVSGYEYIELYSIYEENIRIATDYLNKHASMNGLFRSKDTGKTFGEIANSLNLLKQTRLTQLSTHILQNGLTNNIDYTVDYLLLQRQQNSDLEARAISGATSVLTAIDAYENGNQFMYISPDGTVVQTVGGPTETYNRLFSDYITYTRESVEYGSVVATIDTRLGYFATRTGTKESGYVWTPNPNVKNTPANKAAAQEMSSLLVGQINDVFEIANLTATEYYETEYMKGEVSVSMPAAYLTVSSSLFLQMLIISAAVVFATAVAAIIVTHTVRVKKKKEADAVAVA